MRESSELKSVGGAFDLFFFGANLSDLVGAIYTVDTLVQEPVYVLSGAGLG